MGEAPGGKPERQWALSRRQLLGGGLAGVAGAALAATLPEPASAASARPGAPQALRVDGLPAPIGLASDDVFFAWQVADARRGAVQSAYRIVVTGPATATGRGPLLWDSGKVASGAQAFVPYGGTRLASGAVYSWTVRTWDAAGAAGPTSAHATFETGLVLSDWRASWIRRSTAEPPAPDQYTYARTEFAVPAGTVVRARCYVSGDQQYELSVNGVRAGKGQAYSYPDSKYYETLDLTSLVRTGGTNAVGIVTSWQGATKGHPAGAPGAIAQLVVELHDGHRVTVVTDGSWRVRPGPWLPGTQRDLEGDLVDFTENIDGTAEPVGWLLPGFDDGGWERATVVGRPPAHPWTRLVPVRTRVVEAPVTPISLTTLSSGALVADFGQVYAAVPTVAFHQGTPGRTVTMHAGYLLDETVPAGTTGVPGQVSTLHGTQHTDMRYSYVQRGGGETFHPFDYLGFRYLQVDDPGEALGPGDVVALARHAAVPADAAATFSSSDPTVDAIYALGVHSALYTAQEQYIDTPTREKGPWLFDGFNESCTAMATLGERNLTRKSLLEFAQSQARYWPNGAVNKIYPTGLGALDINESTEIYPEWVWQYWLHTGDHALVGEVYPTLARLAGYVARAVSPSTGLVTSLPATNVYYDFPVVTRLNVLGANAFGRTAALAAVAGRPSSEVDALEGHRSRLVAAIGARLTRPDGTYVDGLTASHRQTPTASQTANACAAAYGVVPAAKLGTVAAFVAAQGMQAPPQTANEVLRTLALAGRTDQLVSLLTDATVDGWANILSRGATFTWEVWNPSDDIGDSMSHGWGSPVAVEIQRSLLGVVPTGPGFSTVAVAPPPSGLDAATGTVPTPRGPIGVAWQRAPVGGGTFALDLTLPPNCTASVLLPATHGAPVTESGAAVRHAHGVRSVSTSDGTVRVSIGAGSYKFAVGTVG